MTVTTVTVWTGNVARQVLVIEQGVLVDSRRRQLLCQLSPRPIYMVTYGHIWSFDLMRYGTGLARWRTALGL